MNRPRHIPWPPLRHLSTQALRIAGMSEAVFRECIETGSPFVRNFLKPKVLSLSPGKLKLKVPFRDEFVGNIASPCLHGGTVAALIDHCGGFCAWSTLTEATRTVSTVDIRVDYLRPSLCEEIICDAHVVHQGGRLIRVDVTCWNATETKRVAIGRVACNAYSTNLNQEELLMTFKNSNISE